MIRILVADDHAVVRRGVIQILSTDQELEVIDDASSGMETMQSIHRHDYDLVLLDIGLPDIGRIEVLKQIHSIKPDLPVLIVSIYSEKQYAVRSLWAGALGYLTKESAGKDPHESLSDRELQVMNMIARDLSISVKTVSTYRSRVLEKLGVHSTGDIIRYAYEHRLAE